MGGFTVVGEEDAPQAKGASSSGWTVIDEKSPEELKFENEVGNAAIKTIPKPAFLSYQPTPIDPINVRGQGQGLRPVPAPRTVPPVSTLDAITAALSATPPQSETPILPGVGTELSAVRHLATPGQRWKGATEVVQGAGEVASPLLGPALAETAAASSALPALKLGGGLVAGIGAQAAAKPIAKAAGASPQQQEFWSELAFWAPTTLGLISSQLKGGIESTPEGTRGAVSTLGGKVGAGVAVTPEGVTIRGKAGPFEGSKTFSRGPQPSGTPAMEPPTIEAQPTGPVSAAANSMVQAEANASQARMRAAGVPPPPPPAPPQIADQPGAPPELKQGHIPQKLVDSFAGIVSALPENLRAQAIQEAHGTLARVILEGSQKGPMVGPDGKLIAPVKDIEGASKVAIGLINDAIGAHDKVAAAAEKEAAKGAEAVSGEATRSSITKTRAGLRKAGGFEVVGEESKGVESTNGTTNNQPSGSTGAGVLPSASPKAPVSESANESAAGATVPGGFQVVGEEPRPQKFQKGEQVVLADGRKGTVRWTGTNPQGKDVARVITDEGKDLKNVDPATLKSLTSEPSQAKTPLAAEGNAPQHILWSRHGETELDVDATNETVAGWTPEPLDERGIASAKKLAGEVKEHKPTVIISSDLERAKQTADIVGKELGIPVKTDERLRPQHVPETEGLKVGAAKPIWQSYEDEPDKKPAGGESWKEFEDRQAGAIKDIHDLIAKGERPMVVTHSRNLESAIGERPEPGEFVKREVEKPFRTRPSEYGPPKRDFEGKVPLENLGFNPNPAEDFGNKARAEVERRMGGALPRGASERRTLASKTEEGVVAKPEGGASPAPVKAENPPTGVQATGETPKYKFGNTQAPIHPDSEAAKALESARARISDSDLMGKGKDVGGDHVTVRYGIQGEETAGIKKFLSQQAPFEASLGKTDKFPPSEHSDGAAVIQVPIEAPELHRLNAELEKHGDFTEPSFKDYKPHATIAYVDPAKADRYTGMSVTAGKKFTVDRVAITDRNGNAETVKLEGKKSVERPAGSAPKPPNPFDKVPVEHAETIAPYEYKPLTADTVPAGKNFFHGTQSTLTDLSKADASGGGELNVYGPGLYLTDNPNVANSYARNRKNAAANSKVLFSDIPGAKLFDLEKPLSSDVLKLFNRPAESLGMDPMEEGITGVMAFAEMRDFSGAERIPAYEMQDVFGDIADKMADRGYDGWRHEGGNLTGSKLGKHNVAVMFPDGIKGGTIYANREKSGGEPKGQFSEKDLEPTSKDEALEAEIKSLKDQAAKVSQEFSLQSLKGYDPHSPLRAKYNDLMKQVLAREDDLARLRGEPTRAEKREMQEKEAAKTFADRPKQSLSYGDPKQSQHWQVLEPDYIEKRFGDKVKQYERAVPEKQAEVDGLKAGTVKHTTAEANLKYWEDLLSKYKARDPRQAQTFKNEYIDLVKKAVSHGSPVPDAVIGQHPEFKVAQDARERYEKGRHTSFANKSIAVNDTMRKEEGFKVKRQDGKAITEEQIKEISGGVDDMVKVLGPELRDMMRGTELTISHTNGKHPFLSDAGGMYHPVDRTISAGIDDFLGRPVRALAHELGHWLDYESGRVLNTKALIRPKSGGPSMETKYVSESDRQTKPLYELARRTMSDTRQAEKMVKTVKLSDLPDQERADIERMKVVLGPYWHEPRELWARMFEQHIGTTLGRGGLASESPESYQNRPAWWTSEAWVKLAPLFEEALKTRMDAMRERYAPKAIEGVSEAKPAPLPTVNGSYEFSKPVVPPKPKIPTKAEVTELEREYGATAQRSTNPDVDLAVGRARGRWQDAKKAYEAAQSVKAEWHNLEEKIVWRGKTMTRAEAIAQEPNANDEILAARPAASYGPKSPPAQTYQEWVAGGRKGLGPAGITKEKDLLGDWFDKLKAGTPGGRGSIIDKIPKDIVKAMYEMAPEDRPISLLPGELRKMHDRLGLPVESLLDRAIKDGAQPIKPVEDVPKAGANFEGRYVRAALEQVAEEWEKITSKSADVEFSKPKTENGHQTLHARLVDGSGVVKIQERGHPHDDYGIYEFAPGKPENLLSASETLARAKDQAESILQSGNFPGGKSKMPKEFKTDKLVIKVPGDGTFVIPNHPAAINHAIEATEEFVPTKEGSSARRVPGSPKEFNAEKYITGVEKEIASLEDDLAKALPNQKVYIAEQLKAARENLAEAKSAKSDRSGERESLLAGESGEANPAKLAEAATKATGAVGDYIRSEAHLNKIARQLQSGMYDLEAEHSGRVLEAVQTMEKVAKEYGEREGDFLADAEQVYFHQEDPTGITLDKDQDELLDDKVLPLMEDTDNKFKALKELDGQQAKLIDNYVHRVTKGKGGWLDRIVSGMKKGTGRGNLLSKSAPQTKGRTMMAVESPSGDRRVVSIKGGKATMWEKGQSSDLGEIKNAKGRTDEENETFPEGQENSVFYDEGKIVEGPDGYDWKITQATTKEIEADTGIQYYHNALASALVSNLQVSKALRGAQFIEAFKKSTQFKEIAFKGAKPPDGWKITQLPQMKDYYFEPHVAEVLDWYADRLRGGDPSIMEKVGNFLRTSIFFNPLIHVPNITVHWLTERGLRGYNPVRFPDTAKAGLKAINAVIHQNQDFLDALEAGAPLQSHREDVAKVTQLFFDQLTEGLEKKEDWALALAKQIGMSPITLIKGIYRFSGKATWVTNDIAVLQSAYEKMQRSPGMSLSDALKETSKHIPDYRLPTRMLNSRALAKVLSNPSITMFMAYHYGAAKSYGEAAKSAIGMGGGAEPPEGGGGTGKAGEESGDSGKRTKAGEIAHGWELLATIGLVTFVLYPLLDKLVQAASGDKNAKMRRAGAATLPYNIYQAATHQKSVGDVVQSVATPAVQTKAAAELIANRDFFTGKNIYDPTADWYTQGQQVGRRLVESVSPIGQASRVAEGGAEARKRFGWGLVGVSFPKTRAERLASQIAMGKTGTKAQSPEDRDDYVERRDILDEFRKGNRRPLMEAERKHDITLQQVHTIERRARRDPLADTVYNFSMAEVKKVLEAAKADDNKPQVELLHKVIREKRLRMLMRGQVEPAPEFAVQ